MTKPILMEKISRVLQKIKTNFYFATKHNQIKPFVWASQACSL